MRSSGRVVPTVADSGVVVLEPQAMADASVLGTVLSADAAIEPMVGEGEAVADDVAAEPEVLCYVSEHIACDVSVIDSGLANEWMDGYYISHWWSEMGQLTWAMVPGTLVSVDGMLVEIRGSLDVP